MSVSSPRRQILPPLLWHSPERAGISELGRRHPVLLGCDRWSEAAPQQQVPSDVDFQILIFCLCSVMFSGGGYFHVGFLLRVAE